MEELLKKCKCGLYLAVNTHRDVYMSAKDQIFEWREQDIIKNDDISPELEMRMIKTNEIYKLQFYPDTPVGFYKVYGTSLEEVVTKALSCFE